MFMEEKNPIMQHAAHLWTLVGVMERLADTATARGQEQACNRVALKIAAIIDPNLTTEETLHAFTTAANAASNVSDTTKSALRQSMASLVHTRLLAIDSAFCAAMRARNQSHSAPDVDLEPGDY